MPTTTTTIFIETKTSNNAISDTNSAIHNYYGKFKNGIKWGHTKKDGIIWDEVGSTYISFVGSRIIDLRREKGHQHPSYFNLIGNFIGKDDKYA